MKQNNQYLTILQLSLIRELEVYWKSFLKETNCSIMRMFYENVETTYNITTKSHS